MPQSHFAFALLKYFLDAMPRAGHAAVTIDGYVYVVGGHASNPTASIERYDAASGTWSSVTSLSVARSGRPVKIEPLTISISGL